MIIADSIWLERYALYRERLLLGPEGPFSDTATELPCPRRQPSGLRWARRGELVPFLRWATEWAISADQDPFELPGRALVATRLVAAPSPPEDLEFSGILGMEHPENLWQSGLAVLALVSEGRITGDGEPLRLALGVVRALRRLGTLEPGYGEGVDAGADGWGYMLRADAVDDTAGIDQGRRTSNFCDWLDNPDSARGLEPTAGQYLGMIAGLILARRILRELDDDVTSANLVDEIEARVRACHGFLAGMTSYRIRRRDGSDVARGGLAFPTAWALASLAAEVSGRGAAEELGPFRRSELAEALVEFNAADRAGITQGILRAVEFALWTRVEPALVSVITPEFARILRDRFTEVWLNDVVLPLRAAVAHFVSSRLGDVVRSGLDDWLDGESLDSGSATDLARAWWRHIRERTLVPAPRWTGFDTLFLALHHLIGADEVSFPPQTVRFQTSTGMGNGEEPINWEFVLPEIRFRPGEVPFRLHLSPRALAEEYHDLEDSPVSGVRVRRASDDALGASLTCDDTGPAPSLVFSPTVDYKLASGHWDGLVRIRDVRDGSTIAQLDGQGGAVQALAFTPDGRHIAAGLRAGTILIWPVESGLTGDALSVVGHEGGTYALAFRALAAFRGSRFVLASGGEDRKLRLWDVNDGSLLREWIGHTASVRAIEYVAPGPSGRAVALASAGEDGAIRLWDPADGRILRQAVSTAAPIHAMAITQDGRIAATGGPDGILRVWNLANGLELSASRDHPGGITAIALSDDDVSLIVGTGDGMSYRYSLPPLRTGLSDRFNRVDDGGPGLSWDTVSGQWRTDGTRLVAAASEGRLLFRQAMVGADNSVRVVIRSDLRGNGTAGATNHGILGRVARGDDGLSGYEAVLSACSVRSRLILRRIVDDVETIVADEEVQAQPGHDHALELSIRGGDVTVLLDESEVIHYSDEEPLRAESFRAGLSWQGEWDDGINPRWDDFQVRPLAIPDRAVLEGTGAVTAVAFAPGRAVGEPGEWLATATPSAGPAYPWRVGAVAESDPRTPEFDPLSAASREADGLLLSLAHLFLDVQPVEGDERFSSVMEEVAKAPAGFPHSGAADGWDGPFRWATRVGATSPGSRSAALGNGLDFLAATAIAAAADPDPENRIAFRRALLLDPA